ncbi:MAG: hypothetical protein K8T25_18660 [Planctomycetia bacterium]|nr:hypothetical protein [Planctomycetia bacterium]
MLRKSLIVASLALMAAWGGCRACDSCYEEGPMVNGGCANCGPGVRSGSVMAGPSYSAPTYSAPTYTTPGYTPPTYAPTPATSPASAPRMVPVQ